MLLDQIKLLRVPLWIGHCHVCTKGSLKLHLSPLKVLFSKLWINSPTPEFEESSGAKLFQDLILQVNDNIKLLNSLPEGGTLALRISRSILDLDLLLICRLLKSLLDIQHGNRSISQSVVKESFDQERNNWNEEIKHWSLN